MRTRTEGWEKRLAALLEAARARPFVWGEWDCCLAAAAAVEALTGVDPASAWRGRYTSEDAARALIANEADGSLHRLVTLGLERAGIRFEAMPHAHFAQRGDLALLRDGGLRALSIVGIDRLYALGEVGFELRPRSAARHVWHFG